jgi:hypothetical protein
MSFLFRLIFMLKFLEENSRLKANFIIHASKNVGQYAMQNFLLYIHINDK